jgi:hypothetical protein
VVSVAVEGDGGKIERERTDGWEGSNEHTGVGAVVPEKIMKAVRNKRTALVSHARPILLGASAVYNQ